MGRCDGIMRGGKRDLESMRLGFDCKLAGVNSRDFILIFHSALWGGLEPGWALAGNYEVSGKNPTDWARTATKP